MSTLPSAKASATVAELAKSITARMPALADRLVAAINQSDDVYRERGLVPPEDLWRSCHDNLMAIDLAIVNLLSSAEADRNPPQATGRRRAEQGLPLENLLHAFRLGGVTIWEGLLEECMARPRPPMAELMEGAVLVWQVIDDYSAEVGHAYRQAEAEILRASATQRQSLLHSLLTGMATDAELSFAAEMLDFPAVGPYVVAVADPQGDTSITGRTLAAALTSRHVRSEWLAREERLVGLLAPRGLSTSVVGKLLSSSGRFRIGISPPTDDLRTVSVAYRHADIALKAIPRGRLEVASLDDRLVEALLVASPELSRRLTNRVLGAILDLQKPERDVLLETLVALLRTPGSLGEVAASMHCHRNTVINRINRIEDLTGLAISHKQDWILLGVALQALELDPAAVAGAKPN
jgi:hypothetical protein